MYPSEKLMCTLDLFRCSSWAHLELQWPQQLWAGWREVICPPASPIRPDETESYWVRRATSYPSLISPLPRAPVWWAAPLIPGKWTFSSGQLVQPVFLQMREPKPRWPWLAPNHLQTWLVPWLLAQSLFFHLHLKKETQHPPYLLPARSFLSSPWSLGSHVYKIVRAVTDWQAVHMHATQASVFSLNIPGCSPIVPMIPFHCPGSILYPAHSKADLPSPDC